MAVEHYSSNISYGSRSGRAEVRGRDTSEYFFGELEQVLSARAKPLKIPEEAFLIDSTHVLRMRAILLKDGERQIRLMQERAVRMMCLPITMGCTFGVTLAAGILAFH